MSALADQLEAVILERGALPAVELALAIRRRKQDVLDTLHSDRRFTQTGKRRASRWSVNPSRSFEAREAAERWDCDLEMAEEIIFGESGFLELGLVASLNGNGRVRVTEGGLVASLRMDSLGAVS